ncbi:nucleoid-associated protein [Agreia bicolorata]
MHQIVRTPGPGSTGFTVVLTDEPVTMSNANLSFLTARFVRALSGRALPIVEEVAFGSAVPNRIRSLWATAPDLAEASKGLAEDLKVAQPGSALPGLLVVAEATLGGDDALLVAKVEHQAAMRIEAQTNSAGHRIFLIEQLRDLVFGDSAKIYKIAVMSKSASSTGPLSGEVVDDQNGNQFARYFLGKFLGMKLREEPAVLTQQFLERVTSAVNESSMPPETKLDVQSALLSELNSNRRSIDAQAFIRDHVPSGFQSEVASLAQSRSAPMSTFPKDSSRVASQISRLRLDLSNGVHVVAPAELVGEGKAVQVSAGRDGQDNVLITGGRLTAVKGNGGR